MDPGAFEAFSESWWPYVIALIIGLVVSIRSYMGGPSFSGDYRMDGKTVIITGGSAGIGYEIAQQMAQRGAAVVLTCRDAEKGEEAAKRIEKRTAGAKITVRYLDVASMESVRKFVNEIEELERVDVLINNAGIMLHPFDRTEEGYEMHFATNYLGHFYLTHLLLPKLKSAKKSRVLNITSQAHFSGYIKLDDLNMEENFNARHAFSQSKLALVMMARYMGEKLKDTGVTINAVNPGLVRNTNHMKRTSLFASWMTKVSVWPWMWLFLKTPRQACQTLLYASLEPSLAQVQGKYISDCEVKEPSGAAKDEEVAEKLYEKTIEMLNLEPLV